MWRELLDARDYAGILRWGSLEGNFVKSTRHGSVVGEFPERTLRYVGFGETRGVLWRPRSATRVGGCRMVYDGRQSPMAQEAAD